MSLLTQNVLVEIVTTLATPGQPLVEATAIIAYCEQHAIDIQGSGKGADLLEPQKVARFREVDRRGAVRIEQQRVAFAA